MRLSSGLSIAYPIRRDVSIGPNRRLRSEYCLHRSSTIPAGELGVLTEINQVSIYRRDAGSRPLADCDKRPLWGHTFGPVQVACSNKRPLALT